MVSHDLSFPESASRKHVKKCIDRRSLIVDIWCACVCSLFEGEREERKKEEKALTRDRIKEKEITRPVVE